MTILRDLYRPVKPFRTRVGRSGGKTKQGQVSDPTLFPTGLSGRSEEARRAMESRRIETLFLADWADAVFLHFEVDREALQEEVPFPLDRFEGKCFVSLVAFTMRGMRFAKGGKCTRWMTAPLATHRFLNLRTYVRTGGEEGIFFMKEWLDNPLSIPLGPKTFGLPYRRGELRYAHGPEGVEGAVDCYEGSLRYRGKPGKVEAAAPVGTLSAFLLERYTAFIAAGRKPKKFRVWHEPWRHGRLPIWRSMKPLSLTGFIRPGRKRPTSSPAISAPA
ncbi:MAG: DUF2071 domain-containing protein [Verrucomicrobiales bacterium]|nr:DUF2071 domain-containing protein [Verrucomicrobiales bacterium]